MRGQQRFHLHRAWPRSRHQRRVGHIGQQYLARFVQVAERGRQAPHLQRRQRITQATQIQLQQHAALVAQQLMPLIHHHAAQPAHALLRIGVAQQQRQRFGRGHQYIHPAFAGEAFVARAGIAGAQPHLPVQPKRRQRFTQRACGIAGQRAQRGDPQHLQRRHGLASARTRCARQRIDQRLQQRPAEHRQRLAAAGRRVQQPGFAGQVVPPHRFLERQRRPATAGEPRGQPRHRVASGHRASACS